MLQWLKTVWGRHIIQDVPPDLARCEYGCRGSNCRHGDWQSCNARILEMEQQVGIKKAGTDTKATCQSST
jgi:hypothetical protein